MAHCVASCILSKGCGEKFSLTLGYLKEMRDIGMGITDFLISSVSPAVAQVVGNLIGHGHGLDEMGF